MSETYIFHTEFCNVAFEDVEWHEYCNPDYFHGHNDVNTIPDTEEVQLQDLLAKSIPAWDKLVFVPSYVSADDFYRLLTYAGVAFSVSPKPVTIPPVFDYDGLTEEEYRQKEQLEADYRAGLIPPSVSFEFPVSVDYETREIAACVRFRDTAWHETDTYTVEASNPDADLPEAWKNAFGEIEIPDNILWEAEDKRFPAFDKECSPYEMWLRLNKVPPSVGIAVDTPPVEPKEKQLFNLF